MSYNFINKITDPNYMSRFDPLFRTHMQEIFTEITDYTDTMMNAALLSGNGWFKDKKTGMIIQWGTTAQVSGQRTIILPIAFPNNAFVPIATCQYGSTIGYVAAGATKTSVILYPNDAGVNPISWFVIGN